MKKIDKLNIVRSDERICITQLLNNLFDDYIELSGDKNFANDEAMLCAIGEIEDNIITIIGNNRGSNNEDRVKKNYGMSFPEGYKKALNHVRLAEKFGRPIVTFIDTAGAFPGIDSEKRGVAKSIANLLYELGDVSVPVITIIMSEGGSGGAIAIGVNDYCICFENAYYSVISPEGYTEIMYKDKKTVTQALEEMPIFAENLLDLNIVDEVILERDFNAEFYEDLKKILINKIKELKSIDIKEVKQKRYQKYFNY